MKAEENGRTIVHAAVRVFARLDEKLRPIIGTGGCESVLGRATVVAARRYPKLAQLDISGCRPQVEDLEKLLDNTDGPPPEVAAALIGEYLAFLGRLVGWRLVLVFLRHLWVDAVADYTPSDLLPFNERPSRSEG